MHRFRTRFLLVGCTLVLAALLLTDPDRGLSTGMLLLALVVPLLAVAFAHVARKALHDYPEADMRSLFAKAGESPIGAGLALVALAILASALLGLFGRSAHAQAQPGPHPRAVQLAPLRLCSAPKVCAWRCSALSRGRSERSGSSGRA